MSQDAKSIAALAGPTLAALGASILLNRAEMVPLAMQLSNDFGLIFLSGALLLVAGIAVVRVHNAWTGDWRSIVTVIGWLAVLGGLVRILFFRQLAEIAPMVVQWTVVAPIAGVLLLTIGAFLSLKAFR